MQAITTGYPIGNWYDPSAHGLNARWITPSPFSTNWTDGEIDYSQTFSMAGLSPSTANITFELAVYDYVLDVLINGHSLGIGVASSTSLSGRSAFQIPISMEAKTP